MALVKCPCAFRLRRLAQKGCREISVRHFSCKFPHKMALVTCSCAFRLRRLAQNSGPEISVRHFNKMALVKCPCRLAQKGCRRISVRHFSCKFPHKTALVKCPCLMCISTAQAGTKRDISNRNLAKRLLIGLIRSLYRDLAKRPFMQDLVQRSCQETSYRDLVQRPGEESSDLPQRSSTRAWTEILLWGPSQRSSVAIS